MIRTTSALLLTAALAGCADPKAANENNFKKAIQTYLDASYPKCYIRTEFPVMIDWDVAGNKKKLQALAAAGLVVESEAQIEVSSMGGRKKFNTVAKFDLTEEGRKYYTADVGKTMGGKTLGGFCLGKATVVEVSQFTEPSEMYGQRISRVNYSYRVSDLPAWVNASAVRDAIGELRSDIESAEKPIKKHGVLVLTNNGWVHEKQFKDG